MHRQKHLQQSKTLVEYARHNQYVEIKCSYCLSDSVPFCLLIVVYILSNIEGILVVDAYIYDKNCNNTVLFI